MLQTHIQPFTDPPSRVHGVIQVCMSSRRRPLYSQALLLALIFRRCSWHIFAGAVPGRPLCACLSMLLCRCFRKLRLLLLCQAALCDKLV